MDDRQAIRIDGTIRTLWDEVIDNCQEASGQEKANRIVAIPPLDHRILNTGPNNVRFRRKERDGNSRVIAKMQNGNRDDEGKVEPIRHINMRLFALPQRA